jgi:hypothetical protein
MYRTSTCNRLSTYRAGSVETICTDVITERKGVKNHEYELPAGSARLEQQSSARRTRTEQRWFLTVWAS